jgi:AraC-like DNA-binding protein
MNAILNLCEPSKAKPLSPKLQPSYRFSTLDLPKEEQFTAYQKELASFGNMHLPFGRQSGDGFRAKRSGYRLADLKIVLSQSEQYSFSGARDERMPVAGDWVLILRMKGWADIEADAGRTRFEGHSVEVRHVGQVRSGHLSDNETLFLYLPRERFRGMEFLLDGAAEANCGSSIHPLLGCYLASLGRVLPTLDQSDVSTVAEATTAMVRACVSYAPSAIDTAVQPIMATRFEVAKEYIGKNLRSRSLCVDSVAAHLSVSRRQLYKMFECHGGVNSYIQARRMEACFQAIAEAGPNVPITRIAEEFGFMDSRRFSRIFRSRFQCSPSGLRELANRRPVPSAFEEWLQNAGTDPAGPPGDNHVRPLLTASR